MQAIKKPKGFTLIELMIVVAIIGILAAVALPAYIDYTHSSKAGTAIKSLDGIKMAIGRCYAKNGGLTTCDSGANGIPASFSDTNGATIQYIDDLSITDGVITAEFTALDSQATPAKMTYTLTPSIVSGVMKWVPAGTACTDADRGANCPTS